VDGCQVIRKIPYQCYLPPRDRNMYAVHWYGDFLNTGLILMKENKLDSAAVLFNKVLVESHGKPVPHLHNYIGMLYFIQNKFNEAGQEFRKEISLNLQKEEAYFQLGKMYFISKDTGKAISALDSVISINPSNADGYLNLGACYMLFKHDSRKAQVYFEKAVESNSNLTNAYFNLLIASQKNNDHESFIKYARILLNKGVTIGDLQANGIVISGELMKKIKS
jgi:tetratricopeptide (TPR) repeat protein